MKSPYNTNHATKPLATTNQQERMMLKPHLKELNPYLKMITISGANDVISQSKVI
ncbi:hypothetical protein [Runella slithyformis]|uniref:hypothetical protein n=1 Tax=Runella slithyformis TaxID=106 RepID=UPI00146C531A|nr:hypothetical protein [Runella slithyformis]